MTEEVQRRRLAWAENGDDGQEQKTASVEHEGGQSSLNQELEGGSKVIDGTVEIRAFRDLKTQFTVSSKHSDLWNDPQLDSKTGFHGTMFPYQLTVGLPKKVMVQKMLLMKRGDGACQDRVLNKFNLEYSEDGKNWAKYQGGEEVLTGQTKQDTFDKVCEIMLDTF